MSTSLLFWSCVPMLKPVISGSRLGKPCSLQMVFLTMAWIVVVMIFTTGTNASTLTTAATWDGRSNNLYQGQAFSQKVEKTNQLHQQQQGNSDHNGQHPVGGGNDDNPGVSHDNKDNQLRPKGRSNKLHQPDRQDHEQNHPQQDQQEPHRDEGVHHDDRFKHVESHFRRRWSPYDFLTNTSIKIHVTAWDHWDTAQLIGAIIGCVVVWICIVWQCQLLDEEMARSVEECTGQLAHDCRVNASNISIFGRDYSASSLHLGPTQSPDEKDMKRFREDLRRQMMRFGKAGPYESSPVIKDNRREGYFHQARRQICRKIPFLATTATNDGRSDTIEMEYAGYWRRGPKVGGGGGGQDGTSSQHITEQSSQCLEWSTVPRQQQQMSPAGHGSEDVVQLPGPSNASNLSPSSTGSQSSSTPVHSRDLNTARYSLSPMSDSYESSNGQSRGPPSAPSVGTASSSSPSAGPPTNHDSDSSSGASGAGPKDPKLSKTI